MTSRIVLLTEENRSEFLPCIMPQVHSRLTSPVVFGFGIYAGRLDEPEIAAGAIVCEYDTGVATVLSVGVLPSLQRRGLGSELVERLAAACARQHHIELAASCWITAGTENPVKSFFVDNDFRVLPGERVRMAVTMSDIAGSSLERHISQSYSNASKDLTVISGISERMLLQLAQDFDLPDETFALIDPNISYVVVSGGEVISASLLSDVHNGQVEIVYLCSKPDEGRYMAAVLLSSLGALYRSVPSDTVVMFNPINDTTVRLAERLLEGCSKRMLHEELLYRPLLSMWDDDDQQEAAEDEV